MEIKKVIIDGKELEYVSKMDDDEYEINEFNLEDTLDLSKELEDTMKIERLEIDGK